MLTRLIDQRDQIWRNDAKAAMVKKSLGNI